MLAVVLRGAAVLLVRRRNPPDAGLWGYPGGKIDRGETLEEAALRELREETGVTARMRAPLGHLDIAAEGFRFRLHIALCDYVAGMACAADDVDAACWYPARDVIAGRLLASRDVDRICLRAAATLS
ncbi:hypothetical protein P775_27980 [Puniceibacterium antarcticum]|uniref:Nudix hydrolase domain-containing protein n=1 Tax=Puniceibacterium antarcticum TaxID=1206336 RepID=A0A2G8QWY9_9RHOB|nr:hypothetical protein P775_27980 [Puniceibacterium antarcticum]